MECEQLIKKILFPIDFSGSSIEALNYVVRLSNAFESDLIVLHTYRLINAFLDNNNLPNMKKDLEIHANNQFKLIEDQYLKSSGIHYLFQSEVGFISDRIISNVKEFDIDLLVLSSSVEEKIKDKVEKGYQRLITEINCPVMFVNKVMAHN